VTRGRVAGERFALDLLSVVQARCDFCGALLHGVELGVRQVILALEVKLGFFWCDLTRSYTGQLKNAGFTDEQFRMDVIALILRTHLSETTLRLSR
jgi:hypothetical protein